MVPGLRRFSGHIAEQMNHKESRIRNHSTHTQVLPVLSEVKPFKKTQAHYFILLNLIQLKIQQGTVIIS
jgi:hypothetical protein